MLGDCLINQGQTDESLHMFLRSRDILTEVSPESEMMGNGESDGSTDAHALIVHCCVNASIACFGLGACFTAMSRLTEAEEALSESVRIYTAVLPQGDSQITQG